MYMNIINSSLAPKHRDFDSWSHRITALFSRSPIRLGNHHAIHLPISRATVAARRWRPRIFCNNNRTHILSLSLSAIPCTPFSFWPSSASPPVPSPSIRSLLAPQPAPQHQVPSLPAPRPLAPTWTGCKNSPPVSSHVSFRPSTTSPFQSVDKRSTAPTRTICSVFARPSQVKASFSARSERRNRALGTPVPIILMKTTRHEIYAGRWASN